MRARSRELAPTDARAWNALGIAAADAGEPARAVDAFARATVLDPRYRAGVEQPRQRVARRRDAASRRAPRSSARSTPIRATRSAGPTWRSRVATTATKRGPARRRSVRSRLIGRQRTARLVLAGIDRRAGPARPGDRRLRACAAKRSLATRGRASLLAGALAERDDLDGGARGVRAAPRATTRNCCARASARS